MQKSQLKSGVYLSYISLFITNLTNLVLTPFIIRNLGDSEYGLYMLIGALIGYIAVLDFGLGNTVVRFVAKYRTENDKKNEENFLFSTFVIYGAISLIILIVGTVLYFNLQVIFSESLTNDEISKAKIMFIILVINLALTLPMKSFTGILTAYEQFILPRTLSIARVVLRAIILFILLSLGYKSIAIVLVDAILNVLMMLITMLYVFLKLKVTIRLHYFDKKVYKNILSYSSLIFISVIVDQIYWRIGHLILGVIASTTEVAVFAIGMTFCQYFITFSTAISGVFLPKITGMVVKKATGEELTNILIKTGRIQFIILGLVLNGFILIGKDFILLWAGDNYGSSWTIALIIMIPLIIVLTQTIGISILQAKNMHGFRAFSYLCIAIINMFISISLAKSYGPIGAAIGTSLSLIFGNIIVMNFYYHLKVKLNIPRFYKELFKGLLTSMLLSLVLGGLLLFIPGQSWLILIIKGVLFTIIYSISMWVIGINIEEKRLFSGEIKKMVKVIS